MSITSAMFTGVSGLLANAEGINVIGNNLSNVNTIGFKSGDTVFSDMLSSSIGNNSQVGRGSKIQCVDNNFSQGSFETTTSVSDLAVQGNSFFALGKPDGNAQVTTQDKALLTRAGSFGVDSTFHLTNPDGYQVLDTNGDPILFNTTAGANPGDGVFAKISKIDSTGLITYADVNGATYYYTGTGAGALTSGGVLGTENKIAVINPPNAGGLDKIGGSLFKAGTSSGVSTGGFALTSNTANGTSEQITSNSLEQSNVDLAAQFVKMILTQRAYSANSKTITTADEMTQEVIALKR